MKIFHSFEYQIEKGNIKVETDKRVKAVNWIYMELEQHNSIIQIYEKFLKHANLIVKTSDPTKIHSKLEWKKMLREF